MTKKFNFKITARDNDILSAIDRCPLTVRQLCKLSTTFETPFQDESNLRRRLRILKSGGLISSFPYVIAGSGNTPNYFKLTKDGYQLLHGHDSVFPKPRHFREIKPGHHHHTFCLAETITHLAVTAHQNDCELIHFARENSVKLVAEPFTLFPDAAFVIRRSDGRQYSFVLEFDNGTERVRSKQDVESVERKLRGYDAHQSQFDAHHPDRYLVLFISTRSEKRLQYVLNVAADVMRQPQRRVFVGCSLNDFLNCDPFQSAVFQDHHGLFRTVVPRQQTTESRPEKTGSFSPVQFNPVVS